MRLSAASWWDRLWGTIECDLDVGERACEEGMPTTRVVVLRTYDETLMIVIDVWGVVVEE